jgi:hypothetical protein
MPEPTTQLRRGVRVFRGSEAREMHDTPMMRKPQVDDAAREALPEFSAAGGTFGMVLFGDPDDPDDGGLSLVRTWFAPNFVLPRHSHSTDCLYYVVARCTSAVGRCRWATDSSWAPTRPTAIRRARRAPRCWSSEQ